MKHFGTVKSFDSVKGLGEITPEAGGDLIRFDKSAIAWDKNEERAPTGSEERAAWIARHAEARELMTFSVTDAYAEARTRLGIE